MPRTSTILAVANQKGGVGKTTLCLNLGAALAARGHRTLLIDLDPQANLTAGLGIEPNGTPKIQDVLLRSKPEFSGAIMETTAKNLHLVASSIDLADADLALSQIVGSERLLHDALSTLPRSQYEYVLIDCPPTLGRLTLNALAAADHVIVPIQAAKWALDGFTHLLNTIDVVRERLNPEISILGIVLTFYNPQTSLARELYTVVKKQFGKQLFKTTLKPTVKLQEAAAASYTIFEYAKDSEPADNYRALAREVEVRCR